MLSNLICSVCQTLYPASALECPVCRTPKEPVTEILSLPTLNLSPFNAGTTTFNSGHMLRVHVLGTGKNLDINFDKYLVLGRKAYEGDTTLDFANLTPHDTGISRRHARLIRYPFSLLCEDLGSTNGTFLNGEPLLKHHPVLIRDGDEVTLGLLRLVVNFISA